jgi:hypothetical protein
MNLPEILQQQLNYAPLQKIDPNTQEVLLLQTPEAAMGQAGIAAILTGLYKLTRSDAGTETIIRDEISSNWVQTIFESQYKRVVKSVAIYTNQDFEATGIKLEAMADKAIAIIKDAVGLPYKTDDVKKLMSNQIHNILSYLPAALQLGELLNDDSLDDRTHKMEGPLSSLIQSIGSGFSTVKKSEK